MQKPMNFSGFFTCLKFHPLFMRAQAVLETLSHSDFEEIRSYRKPPTSVVLVVEGKKNEF